MPFPSLRGALLSYPAHPAAGESRPPAAAWPKSPSPHRPDAPVARRGRGRNRARRPCGAGRWAAYFALLAEDAVFLGTATERWPKAAFGYAHPHFAAGRGWRFDPGTRQIALSADGRVAWFDELLASESYGECRGSGVLERLDGRWLIRQYHLTIPIPNALAGEVVARIRAHAAAPPPVP